MGTKAAWTEERRQRQAEIIRATRPWKHSTGPRTEAGKQTSSRNAVSIWAARKRGLEAVTRNLLAQMRLYVEIMGIEKDEFYSNLHRTIDFQKATEEQQERFVELIGDEFYLKAKCLALWPFDLNADGFTDPHDQDWYASIEDFD